MRPARVAALARSGLPEAAVAVVTRSPETSGSDEYVAANLYELVLRKIMADNDTGFSEESTPEGAIVYIDTSWIKVTNEEADLLRSLHDAGA